MAIAGEFLGSEDDGLTIGEDFLNLSVHRVQRMDVGDPLPGGPVVGVFYWQAHEGYPDVVVLFGGASRIHELDGEHKDNNLERFGP